MLQHSKCRQNNSQTKAKFLLAVFISIANDEIKINERKEILCLYLRCHFLAGVYFFIYCIYKFVP